MRIRRYITHTKLEKQNERFVLHYTFLEKYSPEAVSSVTGQRTPIGGAEREKSGMLATGTPNREKAQAMCFRQLHALINDHDSER